MLLALLIALSPTARASAPHEDLLPPRVPAAEVASWESSGGWRLSAPAFRAGGGTRVALTRHGAAVPVEVRGVSRSGAVGPWRPAPVTYTEGEDSILVAELLARWEGTQVRLPAHGPAPSLGWRLLVPTYPDAGLRARTGGVTDGPRRTPVLRSELYGIDVIDRETWGARPTTCTSREDDWYRMAIHHTAGSPTSGGTVQGAVRFVQAYAQDSGEYCDTPYQFLVGVDGSLWEGRAEGYTSGATYQNNDGNIAVSFMGCFTPSGCPGSSTDVTEEMVAAGQLIVQTLAGLETVNMTDVRGHKDWSGWDHTVCPGDWLYARLEEIRTPLEHWEGRLLRTDWPGDGVVRLEQGETFTGGWELQNAGTASWEPGATFLAPLPRDVTSPLADASWPSPTRASTVDATVAPGATGRFDVTLLGAEPGTYDLAFGLVQEGVTWFADDGGPADDALRLRVIVTALPGDSAAPDTATDLATGPLGGGELPGTVASLETMEGCGCAGASGGASWLGLLAGVLGLLRRAPTRRKPR